MALSYDFVKAGHANRHEIVFSYLRLLAFENIVASAKSKRIFALVMFRFIINLF